jgi:hypothetical protein
MTYFNTPLSVVNPHILALSAPLGTPVPKEADSMQSGYMDDINFILACLEGCFPYNSGSLHHNNTGAQYQGNPVSTLLPLEKEAANICHIMSTSLPLSLPGSCPPTTPTREVSL